MKVWFKRILIGVVVAVIVAIVGLAIFLLTFDPNAYKNKLEEIVYNRYHRTLAIKGDIELSLFPRIGLSLHDVSITDRNSDDTFASIDSARFAVAIWPLISNRLVVDHVAVTGFKAWVVRHKNGQFNFHDLLENRTDAASGSLPIARAHNVAPAPVALAPENTSKLLTLPAVLTNHQASSADFQIDIAGLDLKDGQIHVYDARSGASARIEKLDVNTGRVTFNQPFDVSLKGKLIGDYPVAKADIEGQALVKVNPEARTYSAQKLNVQMVGLLGPLDAKAITLRGNLAYSAYSQLLDVANLELLVQGNVQSTAHGMQPIKNLETSLSVPQLKVDRSQSELNVQKLAFRAKGVLPDQSFDLAFDAPNLSISPDAAKGDPISGTIKLTGDSVLGVALGLTGIGGNAQNLTFKELKMESGLKQGDRLVQFNVSSPANWNVLDKKGGLTAMKGDVKIEDSSLPSGNFEFPLIGSLHADLYKDELASEVNAVLNGGKLDFKVKATHLDDPQIAFDLDADSLDFNKMFPPEKVKPVPADQAKKQGDKPESSDSGKAASDKAAEQVVKAAPSNTIDLAFLDSLDISGNIKVADLKVRDFEAKNVSAAVRAVAGKLDIYQVGADLYGGKLSGKIAANSQDEMATQLTLDGVAAGPLLAALTKEDRLIGRGNLNLNLHTQGTTAAAWVAGLSGSVQAQVRDGAVKGINVAQTLREANSAVKNVFSGQVPDVSSQFDMSRQTDFSSLDASLVLAQGQGTLNKLNVSAPLLRISAGKPASIDLVNSQLDVLVNVRAVNTAQGQGGADLADLKGVTVPVRISGPFAAPGYQIQWKDIGSHAVKQAVQDGLLDLLSDKIDKSISPQTGVKQPKPAAAKPAPDTPAPSKSDSTDTVKRIGNAIKGLLGQ